jgi:fructose 1,6-bisphosphate aldolase/phosphatase
MKITISLIKADIGSIGGHIEPGEKLRSSVMDYIKKNGKDLFIDYYISSTGDDIAILATHTKGVENEEVHKLTWDAFTAGTAVAKEQGLYGAGQDLLVDAFSGNVKGMGPGVAELEFEERPNEPFIMFAADKTEPGAYNLPLYLTFCDPMHCAGLILSPKMKKGFTFTIMDVEYTKGDRVVELKAPDDLYDIAALLRDNSRFVVESIRANEDGSPAAAVSTSRLRNIAGKYTGKDDPVCLVRCQGIYPATGEILSPYVIGHYVAGFMRGSHIGPLMPVPHNTGTSYFDGPPIVTCHAFCVQNGKLTEPSDPFDHPFWDQVRHHITEKAIEIRRQGFSGPAMLPYSDLEYGGIVERLGALDEKFKVRKS